MKGTYVLICRLEARFEIPVGKQGARLFEAGTYAYAGSAMGGIRQRILRHVSHSKRHHWHIDWFLDAATITDIAVRQGTKEFECRTAQALSKEGQVINKFGSSDCSCTGHLVLIDESRAKNMLVNLGYALVSRA